MNAEPSQAMPSFQESVLPSNLETKNISRTPSRSTIRVLVLTIVFFAGLIAIDQLCLKTGRILTALPHWPVWSYRVSPQLLQPTNADVLVMGTCHASMYLKGDRVEQLTGKRISNFGTPANWLGAFAFTFEALLATHPKKPIIMVLDDALLSQDRTDAVSEVESRYLWWDVLNPQGQQYLFEKFIQNPFQYALRHSGLWTMRGKGWAMAVALKNQVRNPIPSNATDQPEAPVANLPAYTATKHETPRFFQRTTTAWHPTAFSKSVIEDLALQAKSAGFLPILLLPPAHPQQKSEVENQEIVQFATSVSQKLNIPLLSYLDNHNRWAQKTEWWADFNHLIEVGANDWLNVAAADLKKVLP